MPSLKRAAEAGQLLLDLVTRDPAFVRGGALQSGDIPVFTFHSLEPLSFERKTQYLRNAGYQAISMATYLEVMTGRTEAPDKSVLLTIDDGRASTWTVAYPILKRLQMRATSFLVTSAVHDTDEVSKTIESADPADRPALLARDVSTDRPFVTWGEVHAMRDVIDIESHTHQHARIAVSAELTGVMTAAMRTGYGEFDCPFIWRDGRLVRGRDVPVGTPLPASAPRLSGSPAYRSVDQRFETESEVHDAMLLDLTEARRVIREKTGADAHAVCYPWHAHSEDARRLAKEAGYLAAFAGKSSSGGPAITRRGSGLYQIARVGEDYLERLPGRRRRSLPSILVEKLRRR